MAYVTLLLGTNLGDKEINLLETIGFIGEDVGQICAKSSVYRSPPWGFESSHDFFNQVLVIQTDFTPEVLLAKLQGIEQLMGRLRKDDAYLVGYQDRLMDIDILFYDDLTAESPGLTIPHPQIAGRRFTLEPLNEIMPDFIHPKLQQAIQVLLENCLDMSDVEKL